MRNRLIILIIVNVVLVGATIILLRMWMSDQSTETVAVAAPTTKSETTQVLVAAENLNSGVLLQRQHWSWQDWPEDGLSEGYISYLPEDEDSDDADAKEEELVGSVVRLGIPEGQPLVLGAIVKPGERGFLAAILEPGYRAVSISVSAATSNGGLIFPGDHVDVILSHRIRTVDEEGNKADRKVAETVLQNIRILAIDQNIANNTSDPNVGKTATLQVTPRQAERLALARDLGDLSLSLRGVEGQDKPENMRRTLTWDYNASLALNSLQSTDGNRDVPLVIRGGTAKK